jgi:antitoxin MazE
MRVLLAIAYIVMRFRSARNASYVDNPLGGNYNVNTNSWESPPMPPLLRTKLIKIGNSQGIRLPKTLLEQSGILGEVEIELQPEGIMIRPIAPPQARSGWEKAFAEMNAIGDDRLLDEPTATAWEETEWEW